jgi:hypothetical protein
VSENRPPNPPREIVDGEEPALTLSARQRDLIERFGVLHDQLGHSPATGRIIGLLLVSPRPSLTFDEIRETLGLSKSSTSAGLNLLLRLGSVMYVTRPGDRRRHFRKNYDDWEHALLERMDTFLALKDLLGEAHELKMDGPLDPGPEIPRMIEFLEFIGETIHDAYRTWAAGRDADGREAPKPRNRVDDGTR